MVMAASATPWSTLTAAAWSCMRILAACRIATGRRHYCAAPAADGPSSNWPSPMLATEAQTIALLADMAHPVRLAGLVAPRRQAEMGTNRAGAHLGLLEEQPVMATHATSRPDYGI
jgi:hypothetical protein